MVAHQLFQVERDGSIPISALVFEECSRSFFQKHNRIWHSRLPDIGAINTMKICFRASCKGECYAVAAWSNPVARALPQQKWLELRRFAIADDAPANTGSKMLGWMVRELRRREPGVERLISYQDCDVHTGTIYRAAGWTPIETQTPGKWNNRKRWNRKAGHIAKKIRWELIIGAAK
jgi:hypothetical protein